MTIAKEIKCDACGCIYHLKLQMDDTIRLFDWPITVECASCGNVMDFKFSRLDGFKRLHDGGWLDYAEGDSHQLRMSPGFLMGYSPTLPIVPSVFHVRVPSGIGFFSPFMNFSPETGIDDFSVADCNRKSIGIIRDVLPSRGILKSLVRILDHSPFNGEAFLNKCVNDLGIDAPELTAQPDKDGCIDIFDGLLQSVYKNLVAGGHPSPSQYEFYRKAYRYIVDCDNMDSCLDAVSASEDIDGLLLKFYDHVSEVVAVIDKLLQGFFVCEMRRLGMNAMCGRLHLMTMGHKRLLGLYATGYELIAKAIPLLAGLGNVVNGREFDDCGTGNPNHSIKALGKLSNGKRVELLGRMPPFSSFFLDFQNPHWRNANEHIDIEYNPVSQACVFRFDSSRPQAYEEVSLMDVAAAVCRQLVFMIEVSKLLWLIIRRWR